MTKSRDRGESPGGPPDAFGHFEDFEDWEGPEPQNVPRNILRILSRAGLRPAILSLGLHHRRAHGDRRVSIRTLVSIDRVLLAVALTVLVGGQQAAAARCAGGA